MSIWLLVALVSYLAGVWIHWTALKQQFQELDEYTNFPIVWVAKAVLTTGCFLEALAWPFTLVT
ncbi:hypothetical protein WA1_42710 [Scytonema hofmannii PCC 7110]|uniref:Uncharacterized protein n=1 Tax=Scytonema hofmannii PCC 7110 TaxID=128403 RepID=A0A139WVG3_9CYAN|nr:hypothetical protein [Scytonema hofmannii]KYC36421.1 hypothetical protein WA1_42710 [Scytonema hofmannii PCC 7110]